MDISLILRAQQLTCVSGSNGYLLEMRQATSSVASARPHEGSRAHRVTLLPTCCSLSGPKHLSKSKGGHTRITGIFVCGSILLHSKNVPTKPDTEFVTKSSCISPVTTPQLQKQSALCSGWVVPTVRLSNMWIWVTVARASLWVTRRDRESSSNTPVVLLWWFRGRGTKAALPPMWPHLSLLIRDIQRRTASRLWGTSTHFRTMYSKTMN